MTRLFQRHTILQRTISAHLNLFDLDIAENVTFAPFSFLNDILIPLKEAILLISSAQNTLGGLRQPPDAQKGYGG